MSAHEEIRWLVSEYCHRYDAGDYEGWAKLFERGRMKVFDTWYVGPAELIPFALRTASPGVSAGKHICFNSSIKVDDDRAEAVTDYWYVPKDITGRMNPVDPQCIWGEYRDTFQVVDGSWAFADRVVVMYDEEQIARNYAVLLARWGADTAR
jgi:hypothetical protein